MTCIVADCFYPLPIPWIFVTGLVLFLKPSLIRPWILLRGVVVDPFRREWQCRVKSVRVWIHRRQRSRSSSSSFWLSDARLRRVEEELDRVDPAGRTPTTSTGGQRRLWGWTLMGLTATWGHTLSGRNRPDCRSKAPGDSSTRTSFRIWVSRSSRILSSEFSILLLMSTRAEYFDNSEFHRLYFMVKFLNIFKARFWKNNWMIDKRRVYCIIFVLLHTNFAS